jgi:hypothetical protein
LNNRATQVQYGDIIVIKKFLITLGALLLLLAVAAGSFYGGMQYQTAQAANVRNQFFADRGGTAPTGAAFPGGNAPAGAAGGPGRGTAGQIKTIDGDTLTISTPQSVVTVTLTEATVVQKSVEGTRDDLVVGAQVVIRGETDASGNVTASTVQLSAAPAP